MTTTVSASHSSTTTTITMTTLFTTLLLLIFITISRATPFDTTYSTFNHSTTTSTMDEIQQSSPIPFDFTSGDVHSNFNSIDLHWGDTTFIFVDDFWPYIDPSPNSLSQMRLTYFTSNSYPQITSCSYFITLFARLDGELQIMKTLRGESVISPSTTFHENEAKMDFQEGLATDNIVHIQVTCQIDPNSWTNVVTEGFTGSSFYLKYNSISGSSEIKWNIVSKLFKTKPLSSPPGLSFYAIPPLSITQISKSSSNGPHEDRYYQAYGISLSTMADFTDMTINGRFQLSTLSNYILLVEGRDRPSEIHNISNDNQISNQSQQRSCMINGVNITPQQLTIQGRETTEFLGTSILIEPTPDQLRAITSFDINQNGGLIPLTIQCDLIQLRTLSSSWAEQVKEEDVLIYLRFMKSKYLDTYDSVLLRAAPTVNPFLPPMIAGSHFNKQAISHSYVDFNFNALPSDIQSSMHYFDYNNKDIVLHQFLYGCDQPSHIDDLSTEVEYVQYRDNMGGILGTQFGNVTISKSSLSHHYSNNPQSQFLHSSLQLFPLLKPTTSTTSTPSLTPSHWIIVLDTKCNPFGDGKGMMVLTILTTTASRIIDSSWSDPTITWFHALPLFLYPKVANTIDLLLRTVITNPDPKTSGDDLVNHNFIINFDQIKWPINSPTFSSIDHLPHASPIDELHIKFNFAKKGFTFVGDLSTCYISFANTSMVLPKINDPDIPLQNHIFSFLDNEDDDNGSFDGNSGTTVIKPNTNSTLSSFKIVISRVGYKGDGFKTNVPRFQLICPQVDFLPIDNGLLTFHDYLIVTSWVNHDNDDTYQTTLRQSLVEFQFNSHNGGNHHDNNEKGSTWKKIILISISSLIGFILLVAFIHFIKRIIIRRRLSGSYIGLN